MDERTTDERLRTVFRNVHDSPQPEDAEEFAFHFRDCKADLERLVEALNDTSGHMTDDAFRAAVNGVLVHAVGHLVQAARMYHGFIDPFGKASSDEHG